MRVGGLLKRALPLLIIVAVMGVTPLVMSAGLPQPNDLFALGQGFGDTPDPAPIQQVSAPPLTATPQGPCDAASKPEPDIQGRVPAGSATNGLWCNMTMISHQGTSGGFKVFDYVDEQGHECAYYDTALLFPANAFNLNSSGLGVVVLNMDNPAKPVQTDMLTEPAMLSPHESLNLNQKRGLIAAVSGNPATYPGWVSIYDAHKDCRHPELQSSAPLARLGHESGFSTDGKTFYATGTAYKSITAIDVTDPKNPHVVWQGNEQSHGMSLSPDGNRAYLANPDVQNGDMIILDTSQIQARKSNPHAREISRVTWDRVSIPQNAIPFTEDGHPYVLEFDEYNEATLNPAGNPDNVGAGRIFDISDETHPRIVANLRLQINQPGPHNKYNGDPGAGGQNGGAQGYAAHYCNVSTRVDPKLVACSFIASGLRLFDISDITKPKEVGYFVAPTEAKPENQGQASDYVMSEPAFVPARHEVWFSDGTSGFYALRVDDSVWPSGRGGACHRARFRVHLPKGAKVKRVRAHPGRVTRKRRHHRRLRVTVSFKSPVQIGKRVRLRIRLRGGHTLHRKRRVRRCF